MTPPELIAGIITEKGVATAPFEESLTKLFQASINTKFLLFFKFQYRI